jgi:hypothetical protein
MSSTTACLPAIAGIILERVKDLGDTPQDGHNMTGAEETSMTGGKIPVIPFPTRTAFVK